MHDWAIITIVICVCLTVCFCATVLAFAISERPKKGKQEEINY